MTKNIYIIFLLVFTLILGQTHSYANPSQKMMDCCMEMSMEKTCTCTSDSKSADEMPCKGKCDSMTSSTSMSLCLSETILDEDTIILGFKEPKNGFFYHESLIPFDFNVIWQPPKIA